MSSQVFSVGVFPVMEEAPADSAPQLVMLANVAAAESGAGEGSDEKEMMELKTVGCNYSDSEEENVVRYGYDNRNYSEVCILEFPESPGPNIVTVVVGNEGGAKAQDLSRQPPPPPSAAAKAPEQGSERPRSAAAAAVTEKKKKPFHCKPCHFQAQNEQEFVEHLGTHGISKMLVVNRVEGRTRTRTRDSETRTQDPAGGEEESGEDGASGDVKGLIRCERCGYNTNRYDHYIAHLKHHSKEGDDHRVFKCTLCPYTTVSQYHWRKHLRNHFPSKLHTCSQCDYFSDRKSNYIQHIRTHTGVRPFQCPYCEYSSSQKTHLTRHMRTHSGERPFKCESCNYLAANQHEVTRHARQVHNGPKPLSCPYCEYKTADRSNFKKHVELHLNPRQFLCPLCKYAASKKCNLQYHIKSRHSGCDVAVDISKVKLRVKKPGPDGAEETSRASKGDDSSSADDFDEDEGEDEDASPINLSIKKSSRPGVSEPLDKTPKKSDKDKQKTKLEPEKKVTTRQKKSEKVRESPVDSEETPAVKRRVKRNVQEQKPDRDQTPKPHKEPAETEEPEQHKDPEGKENKTLNKPKKSGSKKSQKTPEREDAAPDSPEKKKVVKGKRPGEALDLSTKSETPAKVRRIKVKADDKKTSGPQRSSRTKTRNTKKDLALKETVDPVRDHKNGPEGSTELDPQTTEKPGPDQAEPPEKPGPDQAGPPENPGLELAGPPESPGPDQAGPPPVSPQQTLDEPSEEMEVSACSSAEDTPPVAEATPPASVDTPTAAVDMPPAAEAPPTATKDTPPAAEATPQAAEDHPAPSFVKPSPPLLLPGPRIKPSEAEDDEGIHSSHEAGSDISDSASEGSDDSGLNSTGTAAGKNDPETPTDEIPTPTELKSHLCIFCDRTFPVEVDYRRHLNRHLVNVYYLDHQGQDQDQDRQAQDHKDHKV